MPDRFLTYKYEPFLPNWIEGFNFGSSGQQKKLTPADPAFYKGFKPSSDKYFDPNNAAKVYKYLKANDFNDKQIVAIMASFLEESGYNPMAKYDESVGLSQWEPSRYTMPSNYNNMSNDDLLKHQLDHFKSTIHNTKDGLSWTHGGDNTKYDHGVDAYNEFFDPDASLYRINWALNCGYVRPKKAAFGVADSRYKTATELADLFGVKYADGGNVVRRSDKKEYEAFLSTLPDNLRYGGPEYNMYRYWELAGKPKDFDEAINRDFPLFALEDDGMYHAFSVMGTPDGEFEFMKRRDHPSLQEELKWYYSNDPEAINFKREYKLDDSGDFYRYVPRNHSNHRYIPNGPRDLSVPSGEVIGAYNKAGISFFTPGIGRGLADRINWNQIYNDDIDNIDFRNSFGRMVNPLTDNINYPVDGRSVYVDDGGNYFIVASPDMTVIENPNFRMIENPEYRPFVKWDEERPVIKYEDSDGSSNLRRIANLDEIEDYDNRFNAWLNEQRNNGFDVSDDGKLIFDSTQYADGGDLSNPSPWEPPEGWQASGLKNYRSSADKRSDISMDEGMYNTAKRHLNWEFEKLRKDPNYYSNILDAFFEGTSRGWSDNDILGYVYNAATGFKGKTNTNNELSEDDRQYYITASKIKHQIDNAIQANNGVDPRPIGQDDVTVGNVVSRNQERAIDAWLNSKGLNPYNNNYIKKQEEISRRVNELKQERDDIQKEGFKPYYNPAITDLIIDIAGTASGIGAMSNEAKANKLLNSNNGYLTGTNADAYNKLMRNANIEHAIGVGLDGTAVTKDAVQAVNGNNPGIASSALDVLSLGSGVMDYYNVFPKAKGWLGLSGNAIGIGADIYDLIQNSKEHRHNVDAKQKRLKEINDELHELMHESDDKFAFGGNLFNRDKNNGTKSISGVNNSNMSFRDKVLDIFRRNNKTDNDEVYQGSISAPVTIEAQGNPNYTGLRDAYIKQGYDYDTASNMARKTTPNINRGEWNATSNDLQANPWGVIETAADLTPFIGDVKGLTYDVGKGFLDDGIKGGLSAAALGLTSLLPFGDLVKQYKNLSKIRKANKQINNVVKNLKQLDNVALYNPEPMLHLKDANLDVNNISDYIGLGDTDLGAKVNKLNRYYRKELINKIGQELIHGEGQEGLRSKIINEAKKYIDDLSKQNLNTTLITSQDLENPTLLKNGIDYHRINLGDEEKNAIESQVFPRIRKERIQFMPDRLDEVNELLDESINTPIYVIDSDHAIKEFFDRSGAGNSAAYFDPDKNRIIVRRQYNKPSIKVHEDRHSVDNQLPLIPSESMSLENAYDWVERPKNYDADYDMTKEHPTINAESRFIAFKNKGIDTKGMSIDKQNKIIDEMSDDDVINALKETGYTSRAANDEQKIKDIIIPRIPAIKEAWKKVGVVAAPIGVSGAVISNDNSD